MTPTITDRLRGLISDHLGADPEQIADASRIGHDLEADSLDMVELEMAIEEEFGIEYPPDSIAADTTFAGLLDTISGLGAK